MSKKLLSILLVLCMVCTMLPVSVKAEEEHTTTSGEIIAFEPLVKEQVEKTVETGTFIDELGLPETLTATVETVSGSAITVVSGSAINVSWQSNPDYNEEEPGNYDFTPVITGYTVRDGVALPKITVTVEERVGTGYGIWVGGVEVTNANETDVLKDGTVSYNPDSNILTLNGANINEAYTDSYGNQYGIYTTDDLIINRIGHNSIYILSSGSTETSGIYASNNLIITGDGSLTVTGGEVSAGDDSESSGIHIENGNLVVEGGILTSTGAPAGFGSYGICIHEGNLVIEKNATVVAIGDNAAMSAGIFLQQVDNILILNGAGLGAYGAEATNDSYGILSYGGILVGGNAQLDAVSDSANLISCGIYTNEITINDGKVTAIGDSGTTMSYGIYCISMNEILLNGGKLTASVNNATESSKALNQAPIFRDSNHTIDAGLNAEDAKKVEDLDGILNYKYISIEAVAKYNIWVGDEQVTSANKDNIACEHITSGTVAYDSGTNTLILEDVMLTDAYTDADGNTYGIYSEGDLNIKRIGHSSITVSSPAEGKDSAGIHVCGNLTILGDGKLVVTSSPTTGESVESTGIHVDNGSLTVMGGELIAVGASVEGTYSSSSGICVHDGDILITNEATMKVSGDESSSTSFGLYIDGNLTVESGNLEATGGETTGDSYGIGVYEGSMTIKENGIVRTFGSQSINKSVGMYLEHDLIIEGGSLEANGGSTAGKSYGIYFSGLSNQLKLNGGSLTAIGGSGADGSYGMLADIVIVNNGLLEAIGGETGGDSYGIFVCGMSNQLIVEGGSLTATGGAADGISCGIGIDGLESLLQLNGGSLKATGGIAGDDSYGILAERVIVNLGALVAGGDAGSRSYGINISEIKINGGNVVAYGGITEGLSQAMSLAPSFDKDYSHKNYAGDNGVDVSLISDDELINSIDQYKYIEIVHYKEYDIWVGDVQVTTDNQYNITCDHISSGTVTYDPDSNTLTLIDAMLTDAYTDADGNMYGIYSEGDLNIERIGHSSITVSSPAEGKSSAGIHACGSLTILGEGKLVVTGSPTTGVSAKSTGIHIDNGSLIVVGGELITFGAPVTGEYSGSYGIFVLDGDILITSEATVNASGDESNSTSLGVYVEGNLTIESGSLESTGGETTGDSYGISVFEGNMTINENGIVKALGNQSIGKSVGMYLERDLIIEGGRLEAKGGSTPGSSYGVFFSGLYNELKINEDSFLTAIGGSGADGSYGLLADNIYVNNGVLEAIGGDTAGDSYGILVEGMSNQFVVEDESFLIVAGGTADGVSCGIGLSQTGHLLQLNGGRLTAIGGTADDESYGILAENVTVNAGTLEAGGGEAGNRSFGINISEINVNGGTVIAYSGVAKGLSQAMSLAPTIDSDYNHRIYAGSNAIDAEPYAKEDLISNINHFKYIEIVPYIEYDIWVGDVQVTTDNQDSITCDHITGTVTYDPDINTLTLIDAMITDAYIDADGNKYGIYSEGDLNIERIGHSSVTVSSPAEGKDAAGIHVCGNLFIYGDGKLVVTGSPTAGESGESTGIHIDNGDLIVLGGELIAAGAPVASSRSGSYGICVHGGKMFIIRQANVKATGYESKYASFGVYLDGADASLTVSSGSSLKATGGASDYVSYGIYFDETVSQLEVKDGSLIAIGGSAAEESCGILAGKVTVNGGTLSATGGLAADVSYGIYSRSSHIEINGGTLRAYSDMAVISKAMNSTPIFGSSYSHRIIAGTNSGNLTYITDEELARSINGYRSIEVIPYVSGGGSYTPDPNPTMDPSEPITVTVDSNGTANLRITEQFILDAIAYAKAEAKENGISLADIKVVIHVSADGKTASNFTVNLPMNAQQQIINSGIAGIELVLDNPAITIGIDQLAITEINKQANADVQITVTQTDSSKLSTEARETIGDRPVYIFKVSYKNGNVSDFGDGLVYVSIPYTPANNEDVGYLYIVYVDDSGNISRISDSTYDENSNSLIFVTNHFSVYGVGYTAPKTQFKDIDTHWAKDGIDYVVSRGLLSGTTKTTFSPDSAITRGMLVMALGKLVGVDTEAYTTNSFTDVKADSSYSPYIEWACSKGILEGINSKEFEPDREITREEIAVLMANYAKVMGYKLPATRSAIKFADASNIGSTYADAVKAMQQAGIMMSKADNKFDPKAIATRAEVSAMIHRLVKLTINPETAQGWTQNDDGQYLYHKNGSVVTGWQTIDDVEYFFNADGSLKTGWVTDDNGNSRYYSGNQMLVGFWNINTNGKKKTYYFDADGSMIFGKWYRIDGEWYYFYDNGTMAGDTEFKVFEADEKGVRKTK